MHFMLADDSRIFYVWAYRWGMKSNVDLNIEMDFMLAADSKISVRILDCVCRNEYRTELHASIRFAKFLLRHEDDV